MLATERLRKKLLGIGEEETSFARRAYGAAPAQDQLAGDRKELP